MNIDIQQVREDYKGLKLHARNHDELMRTRIRMENRIHARLLNVSPESLMRQFGTDTVPDRGTTEFRSMAHEAVPALRGMVAVENDNLNDLTKHLTDIAGPRLRVFLDTPGIGLKLMARLLGEIGHPVIAFPAHWEEAEDLTGDEPKRTIVEDEPFERTPGQLWQYCGHGKAGRPRKGMDQAELFRLGNPQAKMLTYLTAVGCMKMIGGEDKKGTIRQRSPYRNTYEEAKARYEITRPDPEKGEKDSAERWSKGHRHNAALRITGKEILRDLWVACKADLALTEGADTTELAA